MSPPKGNTIKKDSKYAEKIPCEILSSSGEGYALHRIGEAGKEAMFKKREDRTHTSIVKKFSVVFAVLFVIPMMVTVYLFYDFSYEVGVRKPNLTVLLFFCLLLGFAGHLALKRIVKSILDTIDNVKAVAEGDLDRRATVDSGDEIGDLAENFNKITEKLKNNVEELKKSKDQIQRLLKHISKAVENPFELDRLLTIYLTSIANIIGYRKGVMTVLTSRGDFRILSSIGLTEEEVLSFPAKGERVLRRVIDLGRPLPVYMGSEDDGDGGGHCELRDFMGDSVSLPLIKSRKIFGVLTLATGGASTGAEKEMENSEVPKKINPDDLVMLQNLSAQISTTLENAELRKKMERTYFESIAALATAVEARDIYTNGHSRRVSSLARGIAVELDMPKGIVNIVHDASLLHDIGKIGIPDTILHDAGNMLSVGYYDIIKTHPVIGENILKPLKSLSSLCPGVRHHHERFDGKGYPEGLSSTEIPIEARIIGVADAFDAMTSDRPYRKKMTRNEAIRELMKNAGTQFDVDAVRGLLRHIKKTPCGGEEITDSERGVPNSPHR